MPRHQTRDQIIQRPTLPQSPEIQALAQQVLAASRDRLQDALRGEGSAARSSLGRAARQVAASRGLDAGRSGGVATVARTRTLAPHRMARVTKVRDARALARYQPKLEVLRAELMEVSRASGFTVDPEVFAKRDEDLAAGLRFRKLRMFITELRCREETSNEFGPDHILVGGTRTTYRGETDTVQQRTLTTAISTGGKRTFGTSLKFAGWNLGTDPDILPCVYTAVVVLGEHDDGGFSDLLREIWAVVDAHVKTAVAGLVGAAVGGALGPLGAALGAVIGMLVSFLVDWLLSLFGDNEDDLIDVEVLTIALGDVRKSYYDWAGLTSAKGLTETLFMRGDGGRYELDVAFRVSTD